MTPGDTLAITLRLTAPATDAAVSTVVVLSVVGDGRVIGTIEVPVEIAPG